MVFPRIIRGSDSQISDKRQSQRRFVHVIGLSHSLLNGLRQILSCDGYEVSDSGDHTKANTLSTSLGGPVLRVHGSESTDELPQETELLIHGPSIEPTHTLRLLAEQRSVPTISIGDFIAQLTDSQSCVVISGNHRRVMTAAMTASILLDSGASPSALISGEPCDDGMTGWKGTGSTFILELDPTYGIDCPADVAVLHVPRDDHQLTDGPGDWLNHAAATVAEDGLVLVEPCHQSEICDMTAATVTTVSQSASADWWAADMRVTPEGVRFRIFRRESYFTEVSLPIPGQHHVVCALASAAICHHLGLSAREVREGLRDFRNIRRCYEHVGSWRGVTLIDDAAIDADSIWSVLQLARQQYGQRKIWCVYQPPRLSSTSAFLENLSHSFTLADEILLVIPEGEFAESMEEETGVYHLISQISKRGKRIRVQPSLDHLIATLEDETRPGDVLITMGSGGIDQVQHEFTRRLQRNRTAG